MTILGRVAGHEYGRNVFKKSFLLTLLSVPVMMALNIGVGLLIARLSDNRRPLGYVDQSGVLERAVPAPVLSDFDRPVELVALATEAEARNALQAGRIQAYYVLPADYSTTRSLQLVYVKKPGENATRQFYDFLQVNLAADQAPETADRVAAGTHVVVRSLDGRREVPGSGPTFGILMPLLIAIAMLALMLMSSSYLMAAVADEKENRTIEILATSISAQQIIAGKVLGIVLIGLTLLLTWVAVVLLGLIAAVQLRIGWFQNLEMDWSIILSAAAIALPGYVLVSALLAAIGAVLPTSQEAQSLSAVFIALHLAPLYLSPVLINNPHGPPAVALSLLPFTSLMTVAMRSLFAVVPAWQVAAAAGIQTACALGALWLAGQALRLGMLRYGQRLNWRSLVAARGR